MLQSISITATYRFHCSSHIPSYKVESIARAPSSNVTQAQTMTLVRVIKWSLKCEFFTQTSIFPPQSMNHDAICLVPMLSNKENPLEMLILLIHDTPWCSMMLHSIVALKPEREAQLISASDKISSPGPAQSASHLTAGWRHSF